MSREFTREELEAIVRPLRTAKWQADYAWSRAEAALEGLGKDWGGLELVPDFQRGHVWTEAQQVHFLENCMRGVVASSGYLIQFNCPQWNEDADDTDLPPGLQCVDGLQRLTAVTRFVRGEIKVFGLSAEDLQRTQFSPRSLHLKVAVHDFTKRADLLEHYLSINAGGTPHSSEEIQRVRGLLAIANNKTEIV
jgi:hypothetical protein